MTEDSVLPKPPFHRPNVMDIAPQARELMTSKPITRVRTLAGGDAWMVTRYEYVRSLFNDDRLGRSHPQPENAAQVTHNSLIGGPVGDTSTEQAEHLRMRKLLSPAFSARRMRILEARIQELVDEMLGKMAEQQPPADMHAMFSFPLPVRVICELLGVPFADRDKFESWAYELGNMYDRDLSAAAYEKFSRYMLELIDVKRSEPGEDLISDLIMAEKRWQLNDQEIAGLAVILLFAGHETTVAYIDLGAVFLLVNPDQKKALMEDPDMTPLAVEEILRIVALGSTGLPRYAHSPISIGGVTINTGEAVLLAANVANRDPLAFPDPDRMDIGRPQNQHLSFGYGVRHCLGANLARTELSIVFSSLFRAFPGLRLAVPAEDLEVGRTHMLEGLVRLPVTW